MRYYLDYCHKYGFNASDPRSLSGFIRKLEKKKQTDAQQEQAREAIHMYYELVRSESGYEARVPAKPTSKPGSVNEAQNLYQVTLSRSRFQTGAGRRDSAKDKATRAGVKGKWESAYRQLSNEIEVRHYSAKTLKSYATWVRKMQHFSKSKDPALL